MMYNKLDAPPEGVAVSAEIEIARRDNGDEWRSGLLVFDRDGESYLGLDGGVRHYGEPETIRRMTPDKDFEELPAIQDGNLLVEEILYNGEPVNVTGKTPKEITKTISSLFVDAALRNAREHGNKYGRCDIESYFESGRKFDVDSKGKSMFLKPFAVEFSCIDAQNSYNGQK